ncbi:hypothetical protein [Nocardiopsis sp. JB363]|uniref:hypothetical protein n=1 Tax=Nocardiopsis sp. JB363 TaxID=1434837 RepID=UPI00097AED62|nr:hypothetical protein [Nocardiopsis sp. JB363]SIO89985.1 hypothetical protein BQ8420_24380 [Nocardiopsis sp. JB363]
MRGGHRPRTLGENTTNVAFDDHDPHENPGSWTGLGFTVGEARRWIDAGRRGARAAPWARAGVEASQAVLYRCLGLFPEEAARLAEAGTDAEQLLCAWWDAGIPRAEASSWLIARTSPEDAVRAEAARNGDRPE